MDTRQLSRIDLNLLVALQVLLEERNVSRAAERLFITQSAMSKTLGRLRDLFSDPLLTRSSHGMVPTPRALELQPLLQAILGEVQGLVAGQDFDPMQYKGEFTIAVAEYVGVVALPALVEILQKEAPHISIKSITRVEHQLDALAAGQLDFAIQIQRSEYSDEYHIDLMGCMPPVLLARQGHPLRGRALTWAEIVSYPHVSLYIPDIEELEFTKAFGAVFTMLENEVEEVFETSHLFTALEVVKRTDCLMLGPPFLSNFLPLSNGVVALSLPEESKIQVSYMLVSHKRVANSPAHQWLRSKLLELVARFHRERGDQEDPYEVYQSSHSPGQS